VTRHDVVADLELTVAGRVLARVTGWRDWRFDTDERFWQTIQFPDTETFGHVDAAGFVSVREDGRSDWAWDYLERRYLSSRERDELGEGPRRRRRLLGRIAAKDAVRRLAWQRGAGPLYPVEVEIRSDESGRPQVHAPWADELRVSIAHAEGVAVALARTGSAPGVDVEPVAARGDGFAGIAFTAAEQALLPTGGDRDEWLTRLWCAKEAAGKARGTGLGGSPRELTVEEVDGERVRVDGAWVRTRRDGDTVVAWTEDGRP
jgi:phosphopantetheinyl transferase